MCLRPGDREGNGLPELSARVDAHVAERPPDDDGRRMPPYRFELPALPSVNAALAGGSFGERESRYAAMLPAGRA